MNDDAPKPPNLPMAMVVEVSVVCSIPATQIPELQEIATGIQAELVEQIEALAQAKVYPRWAEARPATRDELLSFVPRKMHYTENGDDHACDTLHVARKNLTRDARAVTCKLCIRFLGARGLL